MPAQHGGLVRSSPVTLAQRTGRTDIRPSVRHGRRPPHVASRSGKSPEAIPLGGDGIQPGSDHVLVDRRGQAETPSSVCRKALFYLFHDAMVLLDLTTPSEACETLSRDEFSGAVLCRLKNRFKPSDPRIIENQRAARRRVSAGRRSHPSSLLHWCRIVRRPHRATNGTKP